MSYTSILSNVTASLLGCPIIFDIKYIDRYLGINLPSLHVTPEYPGAQVQLSSEVSQVAPLRHVKLPQVTVERLDKLHSIYYRHW